MPVPGTPIGSTSLPVRPFQLDQAWQNAIEKADEKEATDKLNASAITNKLKDSRAPTKKLKAQSKILETLDVEDSDFLGFAPDLLNAPGLPPLSYRDRFDFSKNLPQTESEQYSGNKEVHPYSTRDMYTIFNDVTTDYFKHGLQVVNEVTPGQTGTTPFENQDPVIFGFDIVINNIYSPLFNGSIDVFLKNYEMVNEINVRKEVYEDFKNQFQKIFKTRTPLKIDPDKLRITRGKEPPIQKNNNIFNFGKKAYLGYYLKGIKGLGALVENNTPGTKKFITDYGKDLITLDFQGDDVSLSLGTLAYLYKLLYWSRPQGKGIVPENLLRFNCEIIISELRNFKRVRRAVDSGNVEIVKDNLSRYVYSLRECQFYFDKLPHEENIDMAGQTKTYDAHSVSFDYKFSSCKLEKFVPSGDFGVYASYDMGAMWKIGNPGARQQRSGGESTVTVFDENGQPTEMKASSADSSVPKFFSIGKNEFNQNGLDFKEKKPSPFVIRKFKISNKNQSTLPLNEKNKSQDNQKKSKEQLDFERNTNLELRKAKDKNDAEKRKLEIAEKNTIKKQQRQKITKDVAKSFWKKTKEQLKEKGRKEALNYGNRIVSASTGQAEALIQNAMLRATQKLQEARLKSYLLVEKARQELIALALNKAEEFLRKKGYGYLFGDERQPVDYGNIYNTSNPLHRGYPTPGFGDSNIPLKTPAQGIYNPKDPIHAGNPMPGSDANIGTNQIYNSSDPIHEGYPIPGFGDSNIPIKTPAQGIYNANDPIHSGNPMPGSGASLGTNDIYNPSNSIHEGYPKPGSDASLGTNEIYNPSDSIHEGYPKPNPSGNVPTGLGGRSNGDIYKNPQVIPKNPLFTSPRNIYLEGARISGQISTFAGDSIGNLIRRR